MSQSILAQRGVETANLSDLLADFRRQLEQDAGGIPLDQVLTSPALVLDDLCVFLGFGLKLRAKVLGPSADRVEDFLSSRISLCASPEATLGNRVQ
jgi:hypothetical protein